VKNSWRFLKVSVSFISLFRVFVDGKSSKFKTLYNGLPQGSVLSPLLFNLYISDLPGTISRKFIYADDMAIAYQHKSFDQIEIALSEDLKIMSDYFRKWRLCPNPLKSEVSCFHLTNNQKHRQLKVSFNGTILKHNFYPTYLGVTLDTSLNFKQHTEKLRMKIKTRNNILQKLAGSNWGACADTLRTSALALVYSTAEYCSAVWKNSAHVGKVDTQLNSTLRIITGTIKSTPIPWLHVLANIYAHELRRKLALKRSWDKYQHMPDMFLITQDLQDLPPYRLKSRRPIWTEDYLNQPFEIKNLWKTKWSECDVLNKQLIDDPLIKVPGFTHPRKIWCKLNRLRTGHGRCNNMLFHWNVLDSPACECGAETESIKHIVEECPLTRFEFRYAELHNLTPEDVEWILTIKDL